MAIAVAAGYSGPTGRREAEAEVRRTLAAKGATLASLETWTERPGRHWVIGADTPTI